MPGNINGYYARLTLSHILIIGADGETRTRTAFATAPSRRRVYQFHHVGGLT